MLFGRNVVNLSHKVTNMSHSTITTILACCGTAHLVIACVLALYARYKVEYLALTWIMAIFAVLMAACMPFQDFLNGSPGLMHPLMLLSLTAICFLQSIHPLSIPMPAYLQWGRMVQYALPAIVLYTAYCLAMLLGMKPLRLTNGQDILDHWYRPDIWLRLTALVLSVYYIVNILRLPRRLAHSAALPGYLKGYCTVLSGSVIYYMVCTVWYSPLLVTIYLIIFSMLNLYLCFRTLENMALQLPKPTIEKVEREPQPEQIAQAEREDFNEANRQRFQRVEYWMQNHRDAWTQSSFNRDMLCEEVGLNRHLLLQCVRSQGYNSTHEYLNTYRCEELKRLIQKGQVRTLSETSSAGFGTPKTARSVFLNFTGQTLDEYLAEHKEAAINNYNN